MAGIESYKQQAIEEIQQASGHVPANNTNQKGHVSNNDEIHQLSANLENLTAELNSVKHTQSKLVSNQLEQMEQMEKLEKESILVQSQDDVPTINSRMETFEASATQKIHEITSKHAELFNKPFEQKMTQLQQRIQKLEMDLERSQKGPYQNSKQISPSQISQTELAQIQED